MKKILLAAVALLLMLPLMAQKTYKDWHKIDAVTIYQPIRVANYQTLYLPPIDESNVDFNDDDSKKNLAVMKQVAAFRQVLKDEIELKIPGLKVAIVDQAPKTLQSNEMVLNLTLSEFNLGSRAARVWIGFGAGNACMQMRGHFVGTANQPLIDFKHRRLSASMKDYPQLVLKFENTFAEDIINILTHAAD